MNTLIKLRLSVLFVLLFSVFYTEKSYSQCSVYAGPDVSKCLGQPFNPGPFVTTSGTSGTVTYSWNGTTFNASPNTSLAPTVTTTYTLIIQDGNGCTATDQITITVMPLPTVSAGPDITICAGVPTQLCATASSTNGNITLYTWVSGPPSQCWNIAPTIQTTYTVTAVDVAGCQKSDPATVFIYPLPVVNAGADQSMCLSQGSIQLSGSPLGGTWSGANVNSSGLFTPPATGNFVLTYSYTNSNNCTNTDQVSVSVTTPSPINGGADFDICLNAPAIQLNSVGTWSGSTQVTGGGLFTPTIVGTHNLTVTSGAPGCTVTDEIVAIVRPLPVVSAGSDVPICSGQSHTMSGTSASVNGAITSTQWTGSPISNAGILNPSANPTSNTTYTLSVTDIEGCTSSDAMTITVNAVPTVLAGSDESICSNSGPYSLPGFSPSGGTWTGSNVNAAGVFTPISTGSFVLTYTYSSAAGCSSSDQKTITVVPPGTVNAGNDISVCLNTPAVQLTSGGTWTGSTWVSPSGVFTPGATGTFNLTYTASTGQCMASDQLVATVLSLPTANAGADQAICAGQTAQLSASGTSSNGSISSYSWTSGIVSNTSINNPTATPASTSNYTVLVTDAAGCFISDIVQVTVNSNPLVNAGFDLTTCINGGPVAIAGFSPVGGNWSGTNVDLNGVFTPNSLGTFPLTYSYTNANNCPGSDVLNVTVINPGPLNAGADMELCLNSASVQLAAGGTWSGSSLVSPGGLFNPSAIGTHTLTYSAMSGGCMTSDDLIITVKPLPNVNAGADVSSCEGMTLQLNGSATSSNGTITSYQWNSSNVSDPSILNPSITLWISESITLQVTDETGCIGSDQISLTANPIPLVNAGADISFCDQGIAQQLTGFSPAGGVWSGPHVNSTGLFNLQTTGSFTLNYCYTNAFNCTVCDEKIVTVNPTTYANAGSDVELCIGSGNHTLQPAIPGGTWTSSEFLTTDGIFSPTQAGSFVATYTVGSGSCLTTDNSTVIVHALPTVFAGQDAGVCEGESYQLAGSGNGTMPITYAWDNANMLDDASLTYATATISSTQTFTLTVTDGHNCSASDAMTLSVVAMPTASFTHTAIACVNANTSFTNASTNATDYEWSFGNSSNSIDQSPTTMYTAAGIYNIMLTAYNSLGCSHSITSEIEIIGVPHAQFTLSATDGCSPLSVSFTNNSTGQYTSHAWDLGGTPSSSVTPNSTNFETALTDTEYEITLTVSNTCGSHSESHDINVHPQPHAAFTTDLSSLCSPVTTVFANTSQGNPDSFYWDLGDGDHSTDAVPSPKVYITEDDSEDFLIKMYAYNSCGSDSTESLVTVLPNTVNINLIPNVPVGCSPLFIEFNNFTTGATNYNFDFDDGDFSTLTNPNHIFEDAGIYNVIFYANDGCSFDTTIVAIEVLQSPTIVATVDETEACPFEELHFHSSTTGNIQSIDWDFGDGQNETASDPIHAYAFGNNYFISATATDANGCPAVSSLAFEVHPQPSISMNLSALEGCSPLNICSENSTTNATSYNWNFGNGFTSSSQDACQEYVNTSGLNVGYVISLEAVNEFGCVDYEEQIIVVQPQPVTDFTLSQDGSCFVQDIVQASLNSFGSTSYEWISDGIVVSTEQNPSFVFEQTGLHTISVTSYNDLGCTDSHSAQYEIYTTPEIDIMPDKFNGCAPLEVTFENTTSNGATWQWIFGNGAQSTAENPLVQFDSPGLYDVQLTAISEHGCQQVQFFEDMIESFEVPTANFVYSPNDDIIYELDIAFTDSSNGATEYMWEFGDGRTSTEASPIHHFDKGGYFEVLLRVMNEYGCSSEMTKAVNIDNTFYFFMPNSFTPDGDGLNDVFLPSFSSIEEIREYEFQVVNRWGEIIFKTDDPKMAWVGNSRNGEFYTHNDLFTWNVHVSFNNLQVDKNYTGTVTVLR